MRYTKSRPKGTLKKKKKRRAGKTRKGIAAGTVGVGSKANAETMGCAKNETSGKTRAISVTRKRRREGRNL